MQVNRTSNPSRAAGVARFVNGAALMSPQVAGGVPPGGVPPGFREPRLPRRIGSELTAHELRLLRLFVEGHTYKTAAAKLRISTHTVSFHLRSIYEKLQVHSKSQAVDKAMREGLVC